MSILFLAHWYLHTRFSNDCAIYISLGFQKPSIYIYHLHQPNHIEVYTREVAIFTSGNFQIHHCISHMEMLFTMYNRATQRNPKGVAWPPGAGKEKNNPVRTALGSRVGSTPNPIRKSSKPVRRLRTILSMCNHRSCYSLPVYQVWSKSVKPPWRYKSKSL